LPRINHDTPLKLTITNNWRTAIATPAIAFVLAACATIVAPQGGPKDEKPPGLVADETTPNLQTNFKKQRIELTFDEWVQVQDVFNQVLVSPPLRYPYKVSLKRKTVRFDFDEKEVLRDSATYTINFGAAVKDLTEKNSAENLRFVFSTGPYIDSLSLRGVIVDAVTAEPVKGALFMLYDNLADSVVRTERPFYFAKADDKGNFKIENVKAGEFKGFALVDADLNYLFNQAGEKIGFPESNITISADTSQALLIRLFEETKPLQILEADATRYGRLKLAFNQTPPTDLSLSYSEVGQQVVYEYEKDSLLVWYDNPGSLPWELYVRYDTVLNDTARVRVLDRALFVREAKLTEAGRRNPGAIRATPGQPVRVRFSHPIMAVNDSLIQLLEDTTLTSVIPDLRIDSIARRELTLNYPFKYVTPYEWLILPGALTDMYGLTNADTIRKSLQSALLKDFGNMQLRADSLEAGVNYVIQVLNPDGSVLQTFQTQGQAAFEKNISTLPPGQYSLRVIADTNDNGRWDPGHYDTRRQPERIRVTKLEALRANWDLEVVVGRLE
jgi:hypothetical protein